MPGRWPADTAGGAIAILAVSGRALAAAAVRAGFRPLVIDAFADADTRAMALATRRVPLARHGGLRTRALAAALRELPAGIPVVCGSGFEHKAEVLERLLPPERLAGTRPAAIRAVKDPEGLARTLARLGIPHPPIARKRPAAADGWLVKRAGGSGGTHVHPAEAGGGSDFYFQQRVGGVSLSAQVLADGHTAHVLAVTQGWCAPTPRHPCRFGGLAGPVTPPAEAAAAMEQAAQAVTEAFGLAGLISIDFLVEDGVAWLIEVNPRPGASLDVLAGDARLLERHVRAVAGDLDTSPLPVGPARAAAVVYAPAPLTVPAGTVWPDWVADRPAAPGRIAAGAPLCTVLAEAADATTAAALARLRAARLPSAFADTVALPHPLASSPCLPLAGAIP